MPNRLICLTILAGWIVASYGLFRRDLLPEFVVGTPPDLRAIARAGAADAGPIRWAILAIHDSSKAAPAEVPVGEVVTETVRQQDGGIRLDSQAWFDASQWLGGSNTPRNTTGIGGGDTPVSRLEGDRIEVYGSCWIDTSGNLESFRVAIREAGVSAEDLLAIEGRLRNDRIVIVSSGLLPYFGPRSFAYQSRGVVQSSFAPIDRLPGLRVGQRWESAIVNPLTGQVETARSEVSRTHVMTWGGNPITTLEVVTRTDAFSARTWVRRDGLVLRQEVPFPLKRLVLERVPEVETAPGGVNSVGARGGSARDD